MSVESSAMAEAEDGFRQVLYEVEAALDHLQTLLTASLDQWDGEARAAYDVAHAEWRAAAEAMTRSLAWLHRVVETAGANYESALAANLRMWRA